MSDFSDRPFVAGSLIGVRAFDVDELGRLIGPAYPSVFRPDENQATCYVTRGISIQIREVERAIARMSGKPVPPRATFPPASRPEHQIAGVKCGCGFYAYFDGSNQYAKPGRITALIEGYGVCTVGDRGFRAEKARLVALVDPKRRGLNTQLRDIRWSWINLSLGAFCLLMMLGDVVRGSWVGAAIQAAAAVFNGGYGAYLRRGENRRRKTKANTPDVFANYPGVPVYRSLSAALRDHPLTPPEPDPLPTPETVEDFWTRSAS